MFHLNPKDVPVAFGPAEVRRMTVATVAITLACLFTEWLYWEGFTPSYVLSTRIGLHRI